MPVRIDPCSPRTCETTPVGIRTPNLRFRRPTLYPIELQARQADVVWMVPGRWRPVKAGTDTQVGQACVLAPRLDRNWVGFLTLNCRICLHVRPAAVDDNLDSVTANVYCASSGGPGWSKADQSFLWARTGRLCPR